MTESPADKPYALRTTPTVRSALGETLPEAVAVAAYKFITGPLLLEPYRVGKRLLPPLDDRFSARRGTYRIIYRVDDRRASSRLWTSPTAVTRTERESGPNVR